MVNRELFTPPPVLPRTVSGEYVTTRTGITIGIRAPRRMPASTRHGDYLQAALLDPSTAQRASAARLLWIRIRDWL